MTAPFYEDHHVTLYNADCFRMSDLPDASVQCCITSPPYWGLRKYKAPDLIFGGTAGCEHEWGDEMIAPNTGGGWNDPTKRSQYPPFRLKAPAKERQKDVSQGCFCQRCGAWRGQYGLEPTVDQYVAHSLEILREIWRVLRPDGVVFWNVGDSYAGSGKGLNADGSDGGSGPKQQTNVGSIGVVSSKRLPRGNGRWGGGNSPSGGGLKPKDLALIPARIALAAQQPYQSFTIKKLEDRAWLAGIVDGEGCIGIHHYERKDEGYHQFQPFLSVGSSDLCMVENCIKITGCGGSRQKVEAGVEDGRKIVSRRDHYEWRLEGENAIKVIEDIYPHLILKDRQARIAYALSQIEHPHTRQGTPVPEEITNEKLRLWQLCKACNQRDPDAFVDLPPVPQHIEPGWWVRSDIIWNKPNPMPESVTDRPADCHEHIIMLTKSARYYYDAEAVKEPLASSSQDRLNQNIEAQTGSDRLPGKINGNMKAVGDPAGRNLRNVWTFPTQPYPGAHFATFPEELPERCIKAATPEAGSCSKCGKPWHRVIEKVAGTPESWHGSRFDDGKNLEVHPNVGRREDARTDCKNVDPQGNTRRLALLRQQARENGGEYSNTTRTLGWEASCKCGAPAEPATVLEPFAGSGTTLWIAKRLNRRSVGFEISPEYCRLIEERNRQQVAL